MIAASAMQADLPRRRILRPTAITVTVGHSLCPALDRLLRDCKRQSSSAKPSGDVHSALTQRELSASQDAALASVTRA